jgi:hypothetical protein
LARGNGRQVKLLTTNTFLIHAKRQGLAAISAAVFIDETAYFAADFGAEFAVKEVELGLEVGAATCGEGEGCDKEAG